MPLQPLDNYLLQLPNPADEARKNTETSLGIEQLGQRQRQLDLAAQETQLKVDEAARQRSLDEEFYQLAQNPSAANIRAMMIRQPKYAAHLADMSKQLNAQQLQVRRGQLSEPLLALARKEPQYALARLDDLAEAHRNSGDEREAQGLERITGLIRDGRTGLAQGLLGSLLMGTMEEDKFLSIYGPLMPDAVAKAEAESRDAVNKADKSGVEAEAAKKFGMINAGNESVQKAAEASLAKTNAGVAEKTALLAAEAGIAASQAATGASNANKEKTQIEINDANAGVLTGSALTDANKAITDAQSADQLANTAANLAGLAKRSLTKGGVWATLDEAVKTKLGREDAVTTIRKQIQALLNTEVLKGLPPGAASEKELEFAQSAVIAPNANPEVLVDALNRMAALNRTAADLSRARGKWMAQNRGNLAADAVKDFTITGLSGVGKVQVKAGETFKSVQDAIMPPAGAQEAVPKSAGAPTAQQIQTAKAYISHADADPAKVAALKAKFAAAGVAL